MKTLLPFIIFISILSTQAIAECTANRNSAITITKPDSIYIDNSDGTVTDKQTGLMWQKCALGLSGNDCATGTAGAFGWLDAFAVVITANDNNNYGYSDWRLPNKNELESLVENACSSPAINATLFPATAGSTYWSSSPSALDNNNAWVVYFSSGGLGDNDKGRAYFVRLVRGSQ